MRPDGIVVLPPGGQRRPGLMHRRKQRLVQAFIPQPPVEALDERVLGRLPRGDVVPLHLPLLSPALVRPLRQRNRRPGTQCPFATIAAADLQPFLPVDPQQLLVVRHQAFPRQQLAQAPTEAAPELTGHGLQLP